MTQPETQTSLGYVIERVEKLEIAIIKISERMEMLDTIQRDKYKALQKQVDYLEKQISLIKHKIT